MIPRLKKTREEKSKLRVKKRRAKYFWEEKEGKQKVIDWGRYIKVKVPVAPVKYVGQLFGGGQGGGKKYGFAKMATIKKSNRKHTAHVLRLSTERQLAPRPAAILSSEGYTFEEAMERIKALHQPKGRQKNAYLEITCAYESENLLKSYIQELSQKFDSEVFAVIHEDESVQHCHIIISWCNKMGKAIRLQKKDLWNLWETTIRRLQPTRLVPKQKGEGLKKVPYWSYRKAWLQGQEEYQEFCEEQWKKWRLFYEWLNLYDWDIEPPFRRKFFKLWLWEEGYLKESKEELNLASPFETLREITNRLDVIRETPPPEDKLHADVKQAEGMLIFTTTTEATEGDEVGGGGEAVDAQQLVVRGEDKKESKVMVVAMEEKVSEDFVSGREEDKEEVMMATMEDKEDKKEKTEKTEDKEPRKTEEPVVLATRKEPKEPVVVAKEEVPQEGIKEPLEGRKKDEVVAVAMVKEPKDRKEPKVGTPEDKKDKEDRQKVMLAKKEVEPEGKDRKERQVVAMMVAKEEEKERIDKKVVVAKDIREPKEDKDKKEPDMVAIEDKKEREDKKEPDKVMVANTKPLERKEPEEWGVEDLWDIVKKQEKLKKKQIKELEKAIFRSFSQVKTSNKGRAHKGAK